MSSRLRVFKWVSLALFVVMAAMLFAGTRADAHTWSSFDLTNQGRVASVVEQTKYDAAFDQWENDMNSRSGSHGVILRNNGQDGVGGVDYELKVEDSSIPAHSGKDLNYVKCDGTTCRSWAIITYSIYGTHYGVQVHEGWHSFGDGHEPCDVLRTIMHGYPWWPCPNQGDIIVVNGIGRHDLRGYRHNKALGVYDETMGATSLATTSTTEQAYPHSEDSLVKWAKYNGSHADEVHIRHKNGAVIAVQEFYPHPVGHSR